MTPKFTQVEFDNAKSRDFLILECEKCKSPFKLIKKNIKEALNKRYGRTANFCSHKCSVKQNLKLHNINCSFCNASFYRPKSELGINAHNFCSRNCANIFLGKKRAKPKPLKIERKKKQAVNCLNCNNLTMNKKFCSGTCRNKINNQNVKGSKSKAEILLCNSLRENFPKWTVIENDRKILNGLELDVFIPEINLAIEWNGIFHYEPIRGKNCLEKITSKDNRKIELCKQLDIELIVICDRTSHLRFIMETINQLILNLRNIYIKN